MERFWAVNEYGAHEVQPENVQVDYDGMFVIIYSPQGTERYTVNTNYIDALRNARFMNSTQIKLQTTRLKMLEEAQKKIDEKLKGEVYAEIPN